jgi:hypothetical protein
MMPTRNGGSSPNDYDEERAVLEIQYNRESNQVVIQGGPDAFALLADICTFYAQVPLDTRRPIYEDEHWDKLLTDEFGFTLIVNNRLPRVQRKKGMVRSAAEMQIANAIPWLHAEVSEEPQVSYVLLEDASMQSRQRLRTLLIVGNPAGFGQIARTLTTCFNISDSNTTTVTFVSGIDLTADSPHLLFVLEPETIHQTSV